MSVYFFWGDEDYFIDEELKKFRSKLDKNFSEMNYVVYDELGFTDLISVLRTQPMMFGKMMIVINTRNLLSESGTKRKSLLSASLDDGQIKELESAIDGVEENNSEMIDIFFVEKYKDDDKSKSPDSRRKIYKILSKYHTQSFEKIPDYKTDELIAVVEKMAKSKKIKLEKDAASELVTRKGNNVRAYDTELDKLATYALPETTITKKMVTEICSSKEDLFNLTKYIIDGNKSKILKEVRDLLYTKHPLEILIPLQTMLKQWIYVKLNFGKLTNKEIATNLGIRNEGRIWVINKQIKDVPVKVFTELRGHITEAEYKIKTGQVFSPEEELENALIR